MGDKSKNRQSRQYDKEHVRMGDWVEDYSRTKSMISVFRNMRKKKKLNLQSGISALFNQLVEPVLLKCSKDHLEYGDIVQLLSDGQVLAIMVKDEDYTKYHAIPQGSFLTASDTLTPCVRNSFLITNPWKKTRVGEAVCYGEDFALSTVDRPGVPRLYAGADYPFGTLTPKPGHSSLRMSSYPDSQCRLRIERVEQPHLAEGRHVGPDQPFHILSAATHRNLVVNKRCKVLSILGLEKEVSFYYTPDWFPKYDQDNLTNLWIINSTNVIS